MTTFGDNIRTKVASAFTKLEAIPMTYRTGLFTDFDPGAGRAVGTTATDFAVTGFLIEAHHERNESNRQLGKRAEIYLDGGALTTAGVTPEVGHEVIVGSTTWVVAGLHPITPDASPAFWTLDVTS